MIAILEISQNTFQSGFKDIYNVNFTSTSEFSRKHFQTHKRHSKEMFEI